MELDKTKKYMAYWHGSTVFCLQHAESTNSWTLVEHVGSKTDAPHKSVIQQIRAYVPTEMTILFYVRGEKREDGGTYTFPVRFNGVTWGELMVGVNDVPEEGIKEEQVFVVIPLQWEYMERLAVYPGVFMRK